MRIRLLLIVVAIVGAMDRPAEAQVDERHGFWWEVGLGFGSTRFSCDTCMGRPPLDGWTLSLDLGGTPNRRLQFGVEWFQWLNGLKRGSKLPGVESGSVLLTYYPRLRGGPFVEGGVGISYFVLGEGTGDPIQPLSRDTTYGSGTGWGLSLGFGWEVPLGSQRNAIRPRLTYSLGRVGNVHSPDHRVIATLWNQNVLSLEVRILNHPAW